MPSIFSKKNFKTQPWKNGGGTTLELYRIPNDSDGFHFRLSIATVNDDGPFSNFPGINRTIMLLEGRGMSLKFPHQEIKIDQELCPLNFDGGEKIDCRLLAGPLCDFNVMVERNWGKTEVKILKDLSSLDKTFEESTFVFVYKGGLTFEGQYLGEETLLHFGQKESIKAVVDQLSILIVIQLTILNSDI